MAGQSNSNDKYILIVLALILLLLLFLLPAQGYKFNGENPGQSDYINSGSGSQSLTCPQDMDPEKIKDCLEEAVQSISSGSRLKGEWFANAGKKYNISPAFLIAIANKETSLANNGIDYTQPDARYGGAYNVGNILDADTGVYKNYTSFEGDGGGIDGLAKYLSEGYINHPTDPRRTVSEIAQVYCPPRPDIHGNTCDTAGWINQVTIDMGKVLAHCPDAGVMPTGTATGGPVPCVKQDAGGHCGLASVSMLLQFYTGRQHATSQLLSNYGYNLLGAASGEGYALQQIEDFSDPSQINLLKSVVSSGKPVIVASQFPNQPGHPHFMVLTGYDPATDTFMVNNPNVNDCQPISLTPQWLIAHPYPLADNAPPHWAAY